MCVNICIWYKRVFGHNINNISLKLSQCYLKNISLCNIRTPIWIYVFPESFTFTRLQCIDNFVQFKDIHYFRLFLNWLLFRLVKFIKNTAALLEWVDWSKIRFERNDNYVITFLETKHGGGRERNRNSRDKNTIAIDEIVASMMQRRHPWRDIWKKCTSLMVPRK